MGAIRLFGEPATTQGDLILAQEMAHQGLEIAAEAGDEWIASLIRLTMGASLTPMPCGRTGFSRAVSAAAHLGRRMNFSSLDGVIGNSYFSG